MVEVDGIALPVPGDKLRLLLGVLVLEAGRRTPDEQLLDVLWPEGPPPSARESLRVHVARLRKILGEHAVCRDAGGYRLVLDGSSVDAGVFDGLVREARELREVDVDVACARYREAEALWRGSVAADVPFDRAPAEAVRLEELRLVAIEERLDAELAAGHGPTLVPELEQLSTADPLRERVRGQLMLALYSGGRQAEALATYQAARKTMLDELGVEPGPELRALERRILDHDPELPGVAEARSRRLHRRFRILGPTLAAALVTAAALATAAFYGGEGNAVSTVVVPESLVELDPTSGEVESVTALPAGPDAIAVTDDALWVTSVEARTVSRVDRASRDVDVLGGVPAAGDIVATREGEVWVGNLGDDAVTLVNAAGIDFREPPPSVKVRGAAIALDIDDDVLWVTAARGDDGIGVVERIDPRTHRSLGFTTVGAFPASVAVTDRGAWVANYGEGTVSIVGRNGRSLGTIRVGRGPITAVADANAVWVALFWEHEVVRIDPDRRVVVARIPIGEGVWGLAIGPDSVWVANRDSRTLTRIDTRSNRVAATIPLDAAPYGVAYADGRLWVTTQRCGSPNVPCDAS